MTYTTELLTIIFGYLNNNCKYAILRNYEELPENNNSRDIDIIIERKTYNNARESLINLLETKGWQIVTYLISDRLVTWVCGNITDGCNIELIQLDFFFDTSVFGVRLLSANEILEHREFNGKIYHVNKEYEFLDKYLYNRAVGAQYPTKYNLTKDIVKDNSLVNETLQRVFGVNSTDVCDKQSSRKLLMHAAMRAPLANIVRFFKFEYYRIKNYLCSNTGFSIGFTGPDGSGKTTVIDMILEKIAPIFKTAYKYCHFRPALIGNLSEVAHSAGLKKDVDRNYSNPHRGGKTSFISSLLRLTYYSLDYILGYFVNVKSVTRITRLVIFDRYYTDIICDCRRSRIYLKYKFLYWWGKLFIPSLDYNILLTASSETILLRKQELDTESINSINKKIDYLASKKVYTKILNDTIPQEAVEKILSHVFEQQHIKNLKRLNL